MTTTLELLSSSGTKLCQVSGHFRALYQRETNAKKTQRGWMITNRGFFESEDGKSPTFLHRPGRLFSIALMEAPVVIHSD